MGKPLRAVPDMEPAVPDQSLLDAIASGDVLEMLLAQRRLIAKALIEAQDNTRPQYNNELNKLHALIATEQEKRAALDEVAQEAASVAGSDAVEALDPSTL